MSDYRELTLADFRNGNAYDFMRDKILKSDARVKPGRFDAFGLDPDMAGHIFTVLLFLYKVYFRAETHGIENLPAKSSGIIVSNHAPILPYDAMMLATAALVEPVKPRFIRTIVNRNLSKVPYFSTLIYRGGQIIGCDENVRRIFEDGNLVLVFPTGAEGDVHTIFDKYRVADFTFGFMEYALRFSAPVIPTCVTGSEEAAMTLAGIDLPLGGFKHFPITPIFPWLGILGLLPFPSKFDIYFGEPKHYYRDHSADSVTPGEAKELAKEVRETVQKMLDDALGR